VLYGARITFSHFVALLAIDVRHRHGAGAILFDNAGRGSAVADNAFVIAARQRIHILDMGRCARSPDG
jgi:hypothetical protein